MVLDRKRRKIHHKLQEEKTDLSDLPNDVIAKIMSLLPTKCAVATSIISSNWRNLYLLTTNLDLDDSLSINPDRNTTFRRFVNRVLVRSKKSQITKFKLKCGNHVKHSLLGGWIRVALFLHKVTELDLSIKTRARFVLKLSTLTCRNLEVLKLDCNSFLCVPQGMTFPCLKILFFQQVTFPAEPSIILHSKNDYRFHVIKEILSACPLLEELSIIGCDWKGCNLSFSNPLLRKLTLDVGNSGALDQLNCCSIYFNLPSLVFLKYNECLAEKYDIANLNSVVDARFEVSFNDDEFVDPQDLCDTMLDLINGVSNCKFLYLSRPCLEALISGEFKLPDFQNLTRLKLCQGYDVSWNDVLLDFLNSSPCLETLTLVQLTRWNGGGQDKDFLLGDHPVPSCLSSHLKVLILEDFTCLKAEIGMVMYFLEKANVLERMVLHWREGNRANENEILNLPKASEICSISFRNFWGLEVFWIALFLLLKCYMLLLEL